MAKTTWRLSLGSTIVSIWLVGCGGSTGGKAATPTATAASALALATPTVDAGTLATRVAGSPAAKLGPTLLSTADYPPDMTVQRQQTRFVTPRALPGLTSEASGFFATIATASGDEFVSLIMLALDNEAGASTALAALTPDNYLPELATGAPDAATSPLDLSGAPLGSKGFTYAGTLPASAQGQATGRSISGQALGFVRGSTYVLLAHGMSATSARGVDLAKIAAAIDARLAAAP